MGERGHSVLELVIVVALLGLLGAMALPRLSGPIDGARATGQLDRFVSLTYLARTVAVREGTRVRLVYTVDQADCIDAVTVFVVETSRIVRGTELDRAAACVRSNGYSWIDYDSRGMPRGVFNRTVESEAGGATRTAVMSRVGRWRRLGA